MKVFDLLRRKCFDFALFIASVLRGCGVRSELSRLVWIRMLVGLGCDNGGSASQKEIGE